MDKALLELLEKKSFEFITVKEICQKAQVNRSTFYLHYETIGDLLEESAEYIIAQFQECMPHDTKEFLEKLPDRPLDELYLITPEYLMPYLSYVKEHRRVFQATIKNASVLKMTDAYSRLNYHVFAPILKRFGVADGDRQYIMRFYISGLMAVINEWLKEDCKAPIEDIIRIIQICIKHK